MKKKIVVFILFFCFSLLLSALESETIIEIQIEREYSQWLEDMLHPLVGDVIVDVDFILEYPNENFSMYGTKLDNEQSLPGLPVAKSANILDPLDNEPRSSYTKIISKSVSVMVPKRLSKKKIVIIRKNTETWLNLDLTSNDVINIIKSGDLKKFSNSYLISVILLVLAFFILLLNYKKGISHLAKSLRRIKISSIEQSIHVRGETSKESNNQPYPGLPTDMNFTPQRPIEVKMVKEKKNKEKEFDDFHYLEEISPLSLKKLLADCSRRDFTFILSRLKPQYTANFLIEYPEVSIPFIEYFINSEKHLRAEIIEIDLKVQGKLQKVINEEKYLFDDMDTLSNVINFLPSAQTTKILKEIDDIDSEYAKDIRKSIILPNDLLKMHSTVIKKIIKHVSHNMLTSYLAAVDPTIKELFYKNMTERSVLIIREDIALIGKFSNSEKENIIDAMMKTITPIISRN